MGRASALYGLTFETFWTKLGLKVLFEFSVFEQSFLVFV
jgi:hypothetical protein